MALSGNKKGKKGKKGKKFYLPFLPFLPFLLPFDHFIKPFVRPPEFHNDRC